jgi:hypothetical protein
LGRSFRCASPGPRIGQPSRTSRRRPLTSLTFSRPVSPHLRVDQGQVGQIRQVLQVRQTGAADRAAAQIQSFQSLQFLQVCQAGVTDLGTSQRQLHQMRERSLV